MTGDIFAEKIWFFLARYIVVRKWLDLLQMAFWQNLPGSEYVLVHYIFYGTGLSSAERWILSAIYRTNLIQWIGNLVSKMCLLYSHLSGG